MAAESFSRVTLQRLRAQHPAWRLLAADNAPFVLAFLHRAFLASNARTGPQHVLSLQLDDDLREARDAGIDLPRSSEAYLDAWASDDSGWLRKFYPPGVDEPHFDLTPGCERALQFVSRLLERRFVGTQSRLLAVYQLLTEIIDGSEANPDARLVELRRRRDEIDAEIAELSQGHVELLGAAALRDRFQQMATTAVELLSDFRELEQSFHQLDRGVRQKMAGWDKGRGDLLEDVLGDRDAITSSDQGVSFRAFWDFLMSPDRQDELSAKLKRVFELEAIRKLAPDARLRRIHYDWLAAGELTQRTIARLSEQLRRYLDDRAFLENRRLMALIRSVEQEALKLSEAPPRGTVAEVDEATPTFGLPFERPLFAPPFVAEIQSQVIEAGDAESPGDDLFNQVAIDPVRLRANVRQQLLDKDQVTLADIIAAHPLQHGLAELVGYFSLASLDAAAFIDESAVQTVTWVPTGRTARSAHIPLVVFNRPAPTS